MKLALIAAPVLALAVAFMSGACAAGAGSPQSAAAPAASRTAQPSATPQRQTLENAFAYDQMAGFLDTVRPMVAQFFESSYPDLPQPRNVAFVGRGRAGPTPCGGGNAGATSQSYEYCPANDTIYIGQDLLWAFFRMGDAAPVVGLAHEWGHHLQAVLRVPAPRTSTQSVNYENQADCIAGAWARYADAQGWLELPDDLADVHGLMQAIGEREGTRRDHGTATERTAAFDGGYQGGLKPCNAYSTTPLA